MSEKLFIIDDQGKRTAVILEIGAYNGLMAELEALRQKVGRSESTEDTTAESQTEEEKAIVEDRLKALGYL
ncbi:MAG TPA: hypothetical protein DIU35_07300 [Candidatus Latescibacteria bacterium]|nr:hypothetical protein [Candidatus Latescibacterota bacterium]|tara:strand:+ start:1056 stop:1268 length:213 start_codon:yes stop_codon:yes gene_type:complete